jgi:hypothetical protein
MSPPTAGPLPAPAQREQLHRMEHPSTDAIARTIFHAEGLDPADHHELFAAVLDRIEMHHTSGRPAS